MKRNLVLSTICTILLVISVLAGCAPAGGETNYENLGLGFDEAKDYQLSFYGNAQDYYIGLDDSVDDLLIGLGSTVGTTPALGIDEDLAVTTYGDLTFGGTTPVLTVGDGGEEDAAIVYNGAAQDYYIALDDSVDDLLIGKGSTIGTTPAIGIDENLAVATYGDVTMGGTTPVLTVGDAGEEDAAVVYNGAAQDFYIALDDSADDLVVGLGAVAGTTPAFAIDSNLVTTWSGGTITLAQTHTTTDTLTAAECGKTNFLNNVDGFTLTLPAVSTVASGCEFRFVVKTAPTTAYIILTGNTDEDVLAGGINELEVDTGDDGPYDASADTITFVASTAVVGDYVYMISDGAFFYVSGQSNADGGITITDSD